MVNLLRFWAALALAAFALSIPSWADSNGYWDQRLPTGDQSVSLPVGSFWFSSTAWPDQGSIVPSNYNTHPEVNITIDYPSGYPDGTGSQTAIDYSLGTMGRDSRDDGDGKAYQVGIDISGRGDLQTMGLAFYHLHGLGGIGPNSARFGGHGRMFGTFLVEVVQIDPNNHSSFIDVPGAYVDMYETVRGEPYKKRVYLKERADKQGKQHTYAIFGYANGKKGDQDFADGKIGDMFRVRAGNSDSNWSQAHADHYGADWPGKGEILVVEPVGECQDLGGSGFDCGGSMNQEYSDGQEHNGTPAPTPAYNTLTDADKADPSNSGYEGTGGSTSGSSGGGGSQGAAWYDSFWDKFKQAMSDLFTPPADDLNTLQADWNNLANWGPFSLPAQIKREFDFAFGLDMGTDQNSGYWVVALTPGSYPIMNLGRPSGAQDVGTSSDPASADPNGAFHWAFPSYVDLYPYRGPIVLGRSVALVGLWLGFVFAIVKRLIPHLKV